MVHECCWDSTGLVTKIAIVSAYWLSSFARAIITSKIFIHTGIKVLLRVATLAKQSDKEYRSNKYIPVSYQVLKEIATFSISVRTVSSGFMGMNYSI